MYKTNFLNDIKKHGVGVSDLSRQEGTKKYNWHEIQNFLILSIKKVMVFLTFCYSIEFEWFLD